MSDKLRVGIIGCGSIAEKKHIPAILANSDLAELGACSDVDIKRAEELARQGSPTAKFYQDYRALLDNPDIDVVHICTPNATHRDITVAALEAGKHVMCEKPMAHTSQAALEMVEAAKRTGKKLSISYQNRFRDDSLAIHAACQEGMLGEIYYARAQAIMRKHVPTWGKFLSMDAQGGGPLIDIGTHVLDLTLWLMDNYEISSVTGSAFHKLYDSPGGNIFGPWDPEKFEVEDSAFGFIKMKNGATLLLEAAWALNILEQRECMATLCGTKGGAEQYRGDYGPFTYKWAINREMDGRLVTIRPDDPSIYNGRFNKRINEGMTEAPRKEMKQWFEAILFDRTPVVLPEQGYVVSKVLEAIYTSASIGKTVYFD